MNTKRFKLIMFLCVMAVIVLSSWLCDDAYHGLVMSKHLAEGNGLVYNIGERVNASTCPLFTLIIAGVYALFGSGMYLVATGVCIVFSAACVWLMLGMCRDKWDILFLALIFCSKAFISFTTSGLENSLLFLLGMLFFLEMFKHGGGGAVIHAFLPLRINSSHTNG